MNPPTLDSPRRTASLAPIYGALSVLVALSLLALLVAFWPSGAAPPSAFRDPRHRAPAEHPAGNGGQANSRPAVPKRGGVWMQSSPAQGFGSRG